jgi:excinuclease ABC subunit A
VDKSEGIPPAIAIEQRNSVKSTRSTVGTMTELCEYMKLLWPHMAKLYCRSCSQPVRRDSPALIWESFVEGAGFRSPKAPRSLRSTSYPDPISTEEVSFFAEASVSYKVSSGIQAKAIRASSQPDAEIQVEQSFFAGKKPSSLRGKTDAPAENQRITESSATAEVLITFELPLSEKLSLAESLALIVRQGYQRLLVNNQIVRVEEAEPILQKFQPNGHKTSAPASLVVIQDRLKLRPEARSRFCEACEQAYHFGKGKLTIFSIRNESGRAQPVIGDPQFFSNRFHCATCDIEYKEPSSALFSFNHPVGACPTCKGFGRIISIDYQLAIPDRSKSLAEGAVRPWQTGQGAECQVDLKRMCKHYEIPMDVAFEKLPKKSQDWVLYGDPDHGKDDEHQWPRTWYGVKGYFRWLESKAYKMHVRVLLSRYRAYSTCPTCNGQRFQPEALQFKVADASGRLQTLADFYQYPVERALEFIEHIAGELSIPDSGVLLRKKKDPMLLVLGEVRTRLRYLVDAGLGYLTLDRPTRSLSGGETERVNLTTCLGTRLVNTLYVLDEPSVGLHPRDTARLVRIVQGLRDLGNTVVVVEHEASVMRAADQIVDLGPGQGEAGGHIVFQGSYSELLKNRDSLTGQYLSGAKRVELPKRRPMPANSSSLTIRGATLHNLKDLTVEIPLNRLVCLTGVSGSGKTTLAREILLPCLEAKLNSKAEASESEHSENDSDNSDDDSAESSRCQHYEQIEGVHHLGRVVLVDQSPLGRTPRSNPVVYIGAFEDIRELYAQTDLARQRGLNASAFSFNSGQGQCERCRGAGFEKIEMQFLSDVYIRCPDCQGRRYRSHILEVKLIAALRDKSNGSSAAEPRIREWSIADLLEATVDDAIQVLLSFFHLPPGRRALQSLKLLQEIGLGYLRLGQPINTLSGGESQRLKLVSYLAEFAHAEAAEAKPTLFVFDEPTTGLHFEDVRILLKAFQRLVDAGHSLLVIEHNLDVIKSADWVLDLGPEAGERGGQLVAQGTPETIAACVESHTGKALASLLG